MTGSISHRGPDDMGLWTDQEAGVHLGHRRLSIVDLSPSGHQPMVSANGRFVLTFNGEIYNHAALRREIEQAGGGPQATGQPWRGHSDTETFLEGVALWGLKRTLEKCVGMFALVLWDRQARLLEMARDRFGEKPLYYGWVAGGDFVFASELKAIRAHPRFANEIDRGALRLYAARSYVPAPRSIYRDIYKLEPGCILSLDLSTGVPRAAPPPASGRAEGGMRLERYWSYRDAVVAGLERPVASDEEALELVDRTLADAVRGQAVADVPVGAFLSGGIDSSTVVALYQKYSTQKVRTFTIGFEDPRFNEAGHAREVANFFGTEHHEQVATVGETQEVIPQLADMYDEPFGDSSQIPTFLVSRFARTKVTVALSGDGGDELFGGYNRYVRAARLWSQVRRVPRPVRALGAAAAGGVPTPAWNLLSGLVTGKRSPDFGTKAKKALRSMAGARDIDDVFRHFLDEWPAGESPVLGGEPAPPECDFQFDLGEAAPDAARMMYADALSFLPDDILCKVDRAAMAVSLETRAPFLDHRVAEAAARIPIGMKIRGGKGKDIIRKLLYREAPAALFERPKAGFAVPVGEWVKGPLRPWAESLLDRGRITGEGFFDPQIVHRRWRDHLEGKADSTAALWSILMFQAWLDESRPAVSKAA
jgi:asparagine synthase (glutamine-hydrolysing)